MKKVDLNVDIGEGFPYDEALLEFATSANICCGLHAGSWELTLSTAELCMTADIRIACHPGFPDRANFGRRIPEKSEIENYLQSVGSQIHRFFASVNAQYVKPHGALYQILSSVDPIRDGIDSEVHSQCRRFLSSRLSFSDNAVKLMILATSSMGQLFKNIGAVEIIREGFADRRYMEDGTLVPRSKPGAILEDARSIAEQVLELAPRVDSICLHGDTPNCLEFAELIYKTLIDNSYEVGY